MFFVCKGLCACMHAYLRVCVCVCVCMCEFRINFMHIQLLTCSFSSYGTPEKVMKIEKVRKNQGNSA